MIIKIKLRDINLGLNILIISAVIIHLWFFGEMAIKYSLTPAAYLPYIGIVEALAVILLNFKITKIKKKELDYSHEMADTKVLKMGGNKNE